MKKISTLISYSLMIFKIALTVLAIFFVDELIILGFDPFFITPISTILSFILAILSGHTLGAVVDIPITVWFVAVIISWIAIAILLFLGLKNRKARQALFILSIFVTTTDLFLLSGVAWIGFAEGIFNQEVFSGIVLALLVIIVNAVCLKNNKISEG